MPKKDEHDNGDLETTSVRVFKRTLRYMQIVSAWKNITLADYIDHLMRTQGQADLEQMKKDIQKI